MLDFKEVELAVRGLIRDGPLNMNTSIYGHQMGNLIIFTDHFFRKFMMTSFFFGVLKPWLFPLKQPSFLLGSPLYVFPMLWCSWPTRFRTWPGLFKGPENLGVPLLALHHEHRGPLEPCQGDGRVAPWHVAFVKGGF